MSSSLCGSPGKYSWVVTSWCARRRHLQVQVGRPPRVPPGGSDELAAGAVGGDLVRGGLQGVDLEVPLARRRLPCRAGSTPGCPGRTASRSRRRRRARSRSWPCGNGFPSTLVTWPRNSSGVPASFSRIGRVISADPRGAVRDVVRALDGALAALAVLVGDLLDDMFHPHVEEQRPFAVLADVDQPRLERVVLVVADLVLADRLVHGLEHLAGQQVDPLLGGVGDVGDLVGFEPVGGRGAGCGGAGGAVAWAVIGVLLRWWGFSCPGGSAPACLRRRRRPAPRRAHAAARRCGFPAAR